MIYYFNNPQHIQELQQYCLPGGKIINQLTLARYNLPIPEGIVIRDYQIEDKSAIETFIKNPKAEYQLRSESIGSKLRYSESYRALLQHDILPLIKRLKRKGTLLLLQKVPPHSLQRNLYSVQYFIFLENLILEIRAGNATQLARCGWQPSEYIKIPINLLLPEVFESFSQYRKEASLNVHKKNIYLN